MQADQVIIQENVLAFLSRHVLAHLNFSLAGNMCFWPGWDFFCLSLGKTSAGNFWVLLSFCLPLLERPDDGLLKHISSQVQSSKTLFWPDLRDFHLAGETPQLPSRGWAIGYGYFLA